jgi:hypothetical protein
MQELLYGICRVAIAPSHPRRHLELIRGRQ